MKRHALFVGVNKYDDKTIRDLKFSIPDASVLADRFKGLGYKVRLLADPTGAELKSAVMDSVEGLGSGDIFLFFFAGHGFTAQDGSHLLFCRDDIQRLLRVNDAGVRVNTLEALTSDGGFHRAFLLDSCRTDCFAGIEGRGDDTRDLDFVAVPKCTDDSGSFFLLRSCDKFRPSLEFDSVGHGLFTQGLLDAMDTHDIRLACCDTSFATAVSVKMESIQRVYHVDAPQRPSIGECSGPPFSLFDSVFLSEAEQAATSSSAPLRETAYGICPFCGKHNVVTNTFRCKICGKDHLCIEHVSQEIGICRECFAAAERDANTKEAIREHRHKNYVKAFALAQKADQGNPDILFIIGDGYEHGHGCGRDEVESMKWYSKAAELDHSEAQCRLAFLYHTGDGGVQDNREAFKWYLRSAELGNAEAQCVIGEYYDEGDGVPQDYNEAFSWFLKAAMQGYEHAQFLLGVYYECGHGVKTDEREALKWYHKAAEQGNKSAKEEIDRIECKTVELMNSAGLDFYNGRNGRKQDFSKAVEFFSKAANLGYANAQNNLGWCYCYGRGVARDLSEAAKWFCKAAENGCVSAQLSLGVCYKKGMGVPKDVVEAEKWFRMASKRGSVDAQYELGILNLTRDNNGELLDVAEAMVWLTTAAKQGNVKAQLRLGRLYSMGEGVLRDYIEAKRWFRAAADQGDADAQNELGLCYREEKNYVEARKWFEMAIERGNESARFNLEWMEKNLGKLGTAERMRLKIINVLASHWIAIFLVGVLVAFVIWMIFNLKWGLSGARSAVGITCANGITTRDGG